MSEPVLKDAVPHRPSVAAPRSTGSPIRPGVSGFSRSGRSASSSATSARALSIRCRRRWVSSRGPLGPPEVIGVVSLIIWALLIVVTAKYVLFLMQADNKGEGGTLSLMALAQRALGTKTTIAFLLGVAGSALFSGDAMITPAISVLSALEGLKQVDSDLARVYLARDHRHSCCCCSALRAVGTAKVAAFFSPIMVLFFAVNAVLGLVHVASDWIILEALSPIPGLFFLHARGSDRICRPRQRLSSSDRRRSALRRHGPFRTTADPGRLVVHRSAGAGLQLSWSGRADLTNPKAVENPFYLMAPTWALVPLILLSTAATVIASQAVITGAFSSGQPGDPARAAAAARNRPHLLHPGGSDIHSPRQPHHPDRRPRAGAVVPHLRSARQRLRHSGFRHDGRRHLARLLCRLEAVAMVALERP